MIIFTKNLSEQELNMTIKQYVMSKESAPTTDSSNNPFKNKSFHYCIPTYGGDYYLGNSDTFSNNYTQFDCFLICNMSNGFEQTTKKVTKSVELIYYYQLASENYCKEIPMEKFFQIEYEFNKHIKPIITTLSNLSKKYEQMDNITPDVFNNHYPNVYSLMSEHYHKDAILKNIINNLSDKLNKLKDANYKILGKWFYEKKSNSFVKIYNLDEMGNFYMDSFSTKIDSITLSEKNFFNTPQLLELTSINSTDENTIISLINKFNNSLKTNLIKE